MASGRRPRRVHVDARAWVPDASSVACRLLLCGLFCIAAIASVGHSSEATNLTRDGAFSGSPGWSPDGSRIVFSSGHGWTRDIYVINADGTGRMNVTPHDAGGCDGPTWSPDGTKVAYLSGRQAGGPYDIYLMDPDGSARANLTRDEAFNSSPGWSPDGSRIAFGAAPVWHSDVFVMDADGSNRTNLTAREASDRYPSWSPDGLQIAFASDRGGRPLQYDIHVMDTDGTNVRRLTHGLQWRASSGINWSPEGTKIAYAASTDTGLAISVMDSSGQNPRRLTRPGLAHRVLTSRGGVSSTPVAVNSWFPRWSPDGAQIAFVSDRDAIFQFDKTSVGYFPDSTDIYVMAASGEPIAVGVEDLGRELTQWGALRQATIKEARTRDAH
jgi:Tol biopolymer transport system component